MSKKSFSALFEAAECHDEYWTERAIIEFTEALSRWMEAKRVSGPSSRRQSAYPSPTSRRC